MKEPSDAFQLDVLDGLRYGVASYARSEERPAAMRKQEFISQFPVMGTVRHAAGMRFDLEERQRAEPYYVGSLRNRKPRRGGWQRN